MPSALLVGAYGQGNLGDDAVVDAFAGALPGWGIAATTLDPTSAPPSCQPVARRPLSVLRQVARTDALVFGGGTVFKRLHPTTRRHPLALMSQAAGLVAAASLTRRPVAMLGVGTGDMSGRVPTVMARRLVRGSDLLVLRDEDSGHALVRAGIPGPLRVGADPSWVLFQPPQASRPGGGERVLVVPSRLATGRRGAADAFDRLVRALKAVLAHGLRVELCSLEQPHTELSRRLEPAPRDDELVGRLAERLGAGATVRPTPVNLPGAVETLRDAAAVLTFRFHGLIAAGAAGTPTLAVAHEPKLAALARRLGQRTAPVDFDAGRLARTLVETVDSPGPAPAAVKHEIAKAEEGFRLLRMLLSAGRTDESEALGALPLHLWQ